MIKKKVKKENYKKEILEEIKNNSIVLSFALSIIIIGIISLFYPADYTLIMGIAISTLLLTIIQCFSYGNTVLNILPIFTLLLFGFFHDSIDNIPVLKVLLEENVRNLVIYISFSTSFFIQAINNIKKKHIIRKNLVEYNNEKDKIFSSNLQVISNIESKIDEIKEKIDKKDNVDDTISELKRYVNEEVFINNIKTHLISKGKTEEKVAFCIEEVEDSIIQTYGKSRNRKINAEIEKINDEEELEEE